MIGGDLTGFLLLGMAFLMPVLALILFPGLTKEILKDLRLLRILHYVALACLGGALYLRNLPEPDWISLVAAGYKLGIFSLCLAYAAVFAIVTNNFSDLEADRISNPNRPLVQKRVNPRAYFLAAVFCEIFALGLALYIQKEMFWGVLAVSVGYFLYSCKPFRLKKIPILSKAIIGLNSWMVTLCGFSLAGGDVMDFPLIWSVFILVPLAFSANFVDLKDVEGDRQTGVATLPVIMGIKRAKLLIAAFTVMAYLMAGFLLQNLGLALLSLSLGCVHVFFLFRKPYREKPIFLIYVSGLFVLALLVFLAGGKGNAAGNTVDAHGLRWQSVQKGRNFLIHIQQESGAIRDTVNPLFDIWETVLATSALYETKSDTSVQEIKRALSWLGESENQAGILCHNRKCQDAYCLETTSVYFSLLLKIGKGEKVMRRLDTLIALQQAKGAWKIGNPDVREQQEFPSVTAFVLSLLREAEKKPKYPAEAQKWLQENQTPEGNWGQTWEYYDCPAYALWPMLGVIEDPAALDKAVKFILASQLPDGSWNYLGDARPKRPSAELQTALMLAALQSVDAKSTYKIKNALTRGAGFLLSKQRADGSWDGGYFPIPSDRYEKKEYVFATALCLRVLNHAGNAQ